jgi:hypothetical protein
MSKRNRFQGRKEEDTLKDLIRERDRAEEGSEEYKDLTEEIQLLQNDLVMVHIMDQD